MATMTERKNNDLRDTELLVKVAPKKAKNLVRTGFVMGTLAIVAGFAGMVQGILYPAQTAIGVSTTAGPAAILTGVALFVVCRRAEKKG